MHVEALQYDGLSSKGPISIPHGGLLQQTSTQAHRKPVQNLAVQDGLRGLRASTQRRTSVALLSATRSAAGLGCCVVCGWASMAPFGRLPFLPFVAEGRRKYASHVINLCMRNPQHEEF